MSIQESAKLFIDRNKIVEVRALANDLQNPGSKIIASGYYNSVDALVQEVSKIDNNPNITGVYITLNKPNPEHCQPLNLPISRKTPKLSDRHTSRLTTLLIDLDPVRKPGINSTAEELEAARLRCNAVVGALKEMGFPEHMLCMSGNGYHAVFSTNLPVEDKPLVRDFLKALNHRFSDDAVKVDTTVYSPSQITKLYGTMTRKGPDTPERPQRRSSIESEPDTIVDITREQLRVVINKWGAPKKEQPTPATCSNPPAKKQNTGQPRTTIDVVAYSQKAGLEIMGTKVEAGSTIHKLKHCVFNPEHQNNDASIIQGADGVVFYQCFHNSCQGRIFQEVCKHLNCYPDEWGNRTRPFTGQENEATTEEGSSGSYTQSKLEPVPIEVFPPKIQDLILHMVDCFGTTDEIVVASLLAISGALIGTKRLLRIKQDWLVHAALYWMIIARTGDSKSPPINWLMRPLEAVERKLFLEWQALMELHEAAESARKRGDPKEKPPVRKQLKIGDVTMESRIEVLSRCPGGILEYRDELRGLFSDQDKYTGAKGSDQSKFLELYDRRPIQIDRINVKRQLNVYRPSLGILGGTQPKIVTECFGGNDSASGWPGRWITTHSQQSKPALWSEQVMPAEDLALWDSLVTTLHEYDMIEDKNGWPDGRVITVTQPGREVFIDYFNEMTMLPFMQEDVFRETIPKTKEHTLRLCNILHCINHAVSGTDEMTPVTEDEMVKAVTLGKWIYSHNVRTWNMIIRHRQTPEHQPVETRIAQAIINAESEINNGVLATSVIASYVNSGCSDKFSMTTDSIGRICSNRLKLQKNGDKSNRGWIVDTGTIDKLKTIYSLSARALSALAPSVKTPIEDVALVAHKALEALNLESNTFKLRAEGAPFMQDENTHRQPVTLHSYAPEEF
ncbi:MAG: DUF3987 domain-containing protein [Deltaproteobacteria bacterium]|nr:DUF3987 domain-containing protein [Deltaproteobacteria bacterium]